MIKGVRSDWPPSPILLPIVRTGGGVTSINSKRSEERPCPTSSLSYIRHSVVRSLGWGDCAPWQKGQSQRDAHIADRVAAHVG